MRERILAIIRESLGDLEEQLERSLPSEEGTSLYGSQGVLDSLALVSLVVAVEQTLQREFDCPVSLTDENAMSRSRSAFRTVGTLANHASEALRREGIHE